MIRLTVRTRRYFVVIRTTIVRAVRAVMHCIYIPAEYDTYLELLVGRIEVLGPGGARHILELGPYPTRPSE